MAESVSAETSLEDTVRAWLLEDEWKIEALPPGESKWAIEFTNSNGQVLTAHEMIRTPYLGVHAVILYKDFEAAKIETIEPAVRDDFIWELRFKLLELGVGFSGANIPLRKIAVHSKVYRGAVNRQAFMTAVERVQRALTLVQWLFQRRLGGYFEREENLQVM
jgi:hypothetical protein